MIDGEDIQALAIKEEDLKKVLPKIILNVHFKVFKHFFDLKNKVSRAEKNQN